MTTELPPNLSADDGSDADDLSATLGALRAEHRELDAEIERLGVTPMDDELLIRRLKKRKLQLKDQITSIENQLEPDEYA
jgi:hypothetical protein